MSKTVFLALVAVLCLHQAAGASLRGAKEPLSGIDSPVIKAKMEELYGGKIDAQKLKQTWERDPWSTLKTVLGSQPFFNYLQLNRGGGVDQDTRVEGLDLDLAQKAPAYANFGIGDFQEGQKVVQQQVTGLTTALQSGDTNQIQQSLQSAATVAQQQFQDAQGRAQQTAKTLQDLQTAQNEKTQARAKNVQTMFDTFVKENRLPRNEEIRAIKNQMRAAKKESDASFQAMNAALGLTLSAEQLAEWSKPAKTTFLHESKMAARAPFKIYDAYVKDKGRIDHNLEKMASMVTGEGAKTSEMVYTLVRTGLIYPALKDPLNFKKWTVPIEDTEGGAAFFSKPENSVEPPETLTELADIKDWLEGKI